MNEAQEIVDLKKAHPPLVASQSAGDMLAMIERVVSNPEIDVAKIQALLDMKRQMDADIAERAINAALARMDIPHVKKNGKIPLPSKDGSTKDVNFAKWEDIDTVIRPILRAEGLSLSFTAPPKQGDGGGAAMVGRLSHKDGAFREATLSLPLDSGPGRNNLQAMGSTISYGKKYLAFMLLNIVTEGEDIDAEDKFATITVDQAAALDTRLRAISDKALPNFLQWAKVTNLTEILAKKYSAAERAVSDMEAKARKKGAV